MIEFVVDDVADIKVSEPETKGPESAVHGSGDLMQ